VVEPPTVVPKPAPVVDENTFVGVVVPTEPEEEPPLEPKEPEPEPIEEKDKKNSDSSTEDPYESIKTEAEPSSSKSVGIKVPRTEIAATDDEDENTSPPEEPELTVEE
jgi:hypothetical protein